jgi:GT2 family glycosyltransferase
VPQELPSFDLVVATVGRVEEFERFLDSLAEQQYPCVRVLVVDQNEDAQLGPALAGRDAEILHLRSRLGLSRARNVALEHLTADVVAFPDDDCVYPAGLLSRLAERFSSDSGLGGLTGRAEDASGKSADSWKLDTVTLSDTNLWNRANSAAMFLRAQVVRQVGVFDENLGLGSGQPWSSAEEIDYLIRAVRTGARIEYDPSLVVRHDVRIDDSHIGFRDGASVGYLLRKHGYPLWTVGRMLVRPLGGVVLSLTHFDRSRAAYHAATLRGRALGYRRSSSAAE